MIGGAAATVLRRTVVAEPPTCWIVLTMADPTPVSRGSAPKDRLRC